MARRHDYDGRWPRIRAALDGMIADRDAEAVRTGVFAELDDEEAAGLTRRMGGWMARARGQAPQAPIPEA